MKKEKMSKLLKCISTAITTVLLGSCVMVARPIGEPGAIPESQQYVYGQPQPEYQPESEIPEPPPITFTMQPSVIVLPDTNDVYVVPDEQTDIFFWNGWWWRSWEGYWYRSLYYDRGWSYYNQVPSFYYDVDPQWRLYYRDHDWQGHPWYYQRIPDSELRNNWRTWYNDQYWQRQKTWDVRGYQAPSQQRMQEIRNQREISYKQHQQAEQQHWQQTHGQQGPQQSHGYQGQQPGQQRQQQAPQQQQQTHGQQGPQQPHGYQNKTHGQKNQQHEKKHKEDNSGQQQ